MNKLKNTKREPKQRITNPEFKYTNSQHTDIRETFKRFGWTPLEKGNERKN